MDRWDFRTTREPTGRAKPPGYTSGVLEQLWLDPKKHPKQLVTAARIKSLYVRSSAPLLHHRRIEVRRKGPNSFGMFSWRL